MVRKAKNKVSMKSKKEIEKIIKEDKYYLDFLERFDRKKTS